ncbi:hypothetical protein D3C83_176880 [compost metagenome]
MPAALGAWRVWMCAATRLRSSCACAIVTPGFSRAMASKYRTSRSAVSLEAFTGEGGTSLSASTQMLALAGHSA